jgi:tetratricopeptide (TPR) repeat protein
MSFWLRVQNSIASYAIYIYQTFWPLNLAVHYPIPRSDLPFWEVTGSLALLLGITWGTFVLRKRHPYLLVGWLWFIGMLVPVIGLMQISTYAYADRYTYLPQIGLLVMMAWGGEDGLRRFRLPAISGVVLTVIGLLFFTALSFRQTSYWKDSESLWRHSVACNGFNAEARYNLGQALGQKGHVDEAIREYKVALEIAPWHANAHNNLGNQFLLSGRWQEAITEYQTALRLNPGNNLARSNLGYALLQRGRTEEAIREYQVVLQLDSANPSSSYQMGLALIQAGQTADAISHYRQTLRLNPSHVQALNNLANVLATTTKAELRNGGESLQLAWKAAELTKGNNPVIMGTMAAAYAELGRYAEAEQTAGTAMELARQQNNPALALMLEQNGKLYHSHQPLRIISSPR